MKIKHENRHRAAEYLIRQLNFDTIKTDLFHNGIISPNELISNSNFLQSQENKEYGNNIVMSSLIDRFFASDERTALIIEILQNSGAYRTEAFYLNEFLECQKSNASFWTFTKRAYYFPTQYTKLLEGKLNEYKNVHVENTAPAMNEVSIQEHRNIIQDPNPNASDENLSCCQEIEKNHCKAEKETVNIGPPSLPSVQCSENTWSIKADVPSFTQFQQYTIANNEMDSVIASMGQVVVTPMEQSDEKIAAVFHRVTDYEDMSDKSNVDEVNVYEIAKKIGVPARKINGRIQTNRIGKVRKQITRPLKVTFRDEQTRDSFIKMAREKSDVLEAVNIVPFVKKEKRHPFQFWKKNNREKQNHYHR